MKHYTSIEQSKKLLELGIDPLTSDMCYKTEDIDYVETEDDYVLDLICRPYSEYLKFVGPMGLAYKAIPCWSLSALLDVLPKVINNETLFIETSPALWHIGYRNVYIARADNLVDACYEFILQLHKLKLL